MRHTLAAFSTIAALGIAASAAPALAQDSWQWNGRVASGRTIEIKGVNGGIRAIAATGSDVRVTATKSARRSDPAEVTFDVITHNDGITICAVYPHRRQTNECRRGDGGSMNVENNDVTVEWLVHVPAGVLFTGRTVNGDVEATGLNGDAEAYTVNGSIRVSTAGVARAKTVNGSINAVMGRTDWGRKLAFGTVNGSITLTFGGNLNTRVTASTVNGDISTDFPLEVRGRFGPKRVSGSIGAGDRDLEISTVNGAITLRRQ